MKALLNKATLNQRLAMIALVLGLLALVAGDPYRGRIATIDARELSVIVQKEVDHVAPLELADWIIQGRAGFKLVDLRSEKEFAAYAIPGAENVVVSQLTERDLPKNEKIVLYSDGGIHSAQAWFILRSLGFKGVYILRGGLQGWSDEVLFPTLSENADAAARIDFARTAEVSKYFGGTPGSGPSTTSSTTRRAIVAPKLDMPAASAPAGGAKKKKKEGC